jgi:CheY-like chemotaxis protein/two-component sensor histidine kinase
MRLEHSGKPQVLRAQEVIERQIQQMSHLIDDLLDVSRITRDSFVLRKERVELSGIIANAVEISRPLIAEGRHTLRTTLPAVPVILSADPTRLGQVVSNLLNNAAKYTEPGGQIDLIAEVRGGEVHLRVRDNGMGIGPEMLSRIFELFIQGNQTPDRAKGGLGIGLTLVRRLVEMHEGSVDVHSDGPGKGTEFMVKLPILQGVAQPSDPSDSDHASIQAMARLRVLIVDDNQDAAEMLSLMLGVWGHETRSAHDGLSAFDEAEAFRPHLVLLDIGLPKLDGYGVARKIRQQPWGKDMRLIAVTGWGQESDRREGFDAGFDSHFVKPVDPLSLRKVLAELTPR